jgi:hypothetical protein
MVLAKDSIARKARRRVAGGAGHGGESGFNDDGKSDRRCFLPGCGGA